MIAPSRQSRLRPLPSVNGAVDCGSAVAASCPQRSSLGQLPSEWAKRLGKTSHGDGGRQCRERDVFFLLMGAILVFAMHGGFAFLEAGTVRHKNQVNALVQNPGRFRHLDGRLFLRSATRSPTASASSQSARRLPAAPTASRRRASRSSSFFFLCTFAAAVPAIISGGIAERAKFVPQCAATALLVGLFYPLLRRHRLEQELRPAGELLQGAARRASSRISPARSSCTRSAAGRRSAPCCLLGPRLGRYDRDAPSAFRPSSIPWLAMGSWLLCIGWFGFNVMSAQSLKAVSGLVAINSLMAMCGGIIAALIVGDNDPGLRPQRRARRPRRRVRRLRRHAPDRLAVRRRRRRRHLRPRCSRSSTNKWKFDDVLGVWPLHGLCGLWGGIACGIFGLTVLGGTGRRQLRLAARRQRSRRGLRLRGRHRRLRRGRS